MGYRAPSDLKGKGEKAEVHSHVPIVSSFSFAFCPFTLHRVWLPVAEDGFRNPPTSPCISVIHREVELGFVFTCSFVALSHPAPLVFRVSP